MQTIEHGCCSLSRPSQGLAGVGVSPQHARSGIPVLQFSQDSRTILDVSCNQGTSKKSDLSFIMSHSEDVDVSELRQKRLKTMSAASSSHEDENERPKPCYCFEKSDCVVRKLRAQRLKEFSSVRRKLDFGALQDSSSTVDPFAQLREQSSKVWNFDFEEEAPLPGNWIWAKETQQPALQTREEIDEPKNDNTRHKTLKDLFRVSKNRSRKRSVDNQFRLPLAPIRTTETSPA